MTQPDFIQIPQPVLTDKNLQLSDKIVFGYIYWMTKLALMKCIASNSTLAELCDVSVRNIQFSLNRLEEQGYIQRIYKDEKSLNREEIKCLVTYGKTSPTPRTTVHRGMKPSSRGVRTTVHHTNKREEDNLNIDTKVSMGAEAPVDTFGTPEINGMFKVWADTTGLPIQRLARRNRLACYSLLKSLGAERLTALIQLVQASKLDKYAPVITDFISLELKLGQLEAWIARNNTPSPAPLYPNVGAMLHPEKYGATR